MVKHQAEQADKQETGIKMPTLRNRKFHSKKGLTKIQDKRCRNRRLTLQEKTLAASPEKTKIREYLKVLVRTLEAAGWTRAQQQSTGRLQNIRHRLCPAIPTALKEPEQKFASNCKVLRQTREQIVVAVLRQPQQPKAILEQHLQLALPEVVPQL